MLTVVELILFWSSFDVVHIFYRLILLIIHQQKLKSSELPLVSILIPAYNEEVSIEKALVSCLEQTYPYLEVIVVNDGSTDNTCEIISSFRKKHFLYLLQKKINFKIVNQPNQGKARALNNGLLQAKGDFVVTIDADSYIHAHAIEKIMSYFSSEKIGAVAGNVVAISNHSILGYLQKMEYELGIYFIRNSQGSLGDVIVTPGALSAYRKIAVRKFEEGTITEDFDSSIRVLERGYEIVMAPNAICYTQVPLTIQDLIKQRVRWQQGGLEVFAKHIFHQKRLSVSLEWLFLFLFGFYALFNKVLALFTIPLVLVSDNSASIPKAIILFFMYSWVVYTVLFSIVTYYSKDKQALLFVPLFILYFHTIILYSVFAAQILMFKTGKKPWEKIKRYRI